MNSEKNIKRYIKSIRDLLPTSGSEADGIIAMIENNLRCKINDNPDRDFSEIIKEFGTPEEVVSMYVATNTFSCQKRKFFSAKKLLISIGLGLATAIIIIGFIFIKEMINDANSYVTITTNVGEPELISKEYWNIPD